MMPSKTKPLEDKKLLDDQCRESQKQLRNTMSETSREGTPARLVSKNFPEGFDDERYYAAYACAGRSDRVAPCPKGNLILSC